MSSVVQGERPARSSSPPCTCHAHGVHIRARDDLAPALSRLGPDTVHSSEGHRIARYPYVSSHSTTTSGRVVHRGRLFRTTACRRSAYHPRVPSADLPCSLNFHDPSDHRPRRVFPVGLGHRARCTPRDPLSPQREARRACAGSRWSTAFRSACCISRCVVQPALRSSMT